MKRVLRKMKTGLKHRLKVFKKLPAQKLEKLHWYPSESRALRGHALERADAISSSVTEKDKYILAAYRNLGISAISAGGMGGKKWAFRAHTWLQVWWQGPRWW